MSIYKGILTIPLSVGFVISKFLVMKADLVISFSFSACIVRNNIETPSSFKNASSALGEFLVKPSMNKNCQEVKMKCHSLCSVVNALSCTCISVV